MKYKYKKFKFMSIDEITDSMVDEYLKKISVYLKFDEYNHSQFLDHYKIISNQVVKVLCEPFFTKDKQHYIQFKSNINDLPSIDGKTYVWFDLLKIFALPYTNLQIKDKEFMLK